MKPVHCARVRTDSQASVRGTVRSYRDLVVWRDVKVRRGQHVTVDLRNVSPVVFRDGRIVVLRLRRAA